MTLVRSVLDLGEAQIDWILDRSRLHRAQDARSSTTSGVLVGLVFLETSLRTRIGFAAAAARLGGTSIDVLGMRASAVSMPETLDDTLRTLAGYVDVIIARVTEPLAVPAGVAVPVLNGGDRGARAEHPSQALIDLFALREIPRAFDTLVVALCGDLRMRAVTSLLLLFTRRPPCRLVLVTEPSLTAGFRAPPELADIVDHRSLDDLGDVDALYVAGIPHGALDEDGRTRLRVTSTHLDRLPPHARVLSPMPVIDEIEREALAHEKSCVFRQSDDGLFVRMAVLECLLGAGPGGPSSTDGGGVEER
jgi:aspartate carbamoyltransferase catalytic subunit